MAATLETLCSFGDITESLNCGETPAGISSEILIGFKEDVVALPAFKKAAQGATEFPLSGFAEIEPTPGFKMKVGKRFYRFVISSDSGQFTSTSVKQGKGYNAQLVFKIEKMDATISALLRIMNNRKDIIVAIPEDDGKYSMLYHPTRNVKITDGGIAYDSGTDPSSDSGTTVTMTCPALSPVTYYSGTISTIPGTV